MNYYGDDYEKLEAKTMYVEYVYLAPLTFNAPASPLAVPIDFSSQ